MTEDAVGGTAADGPANARESGEAADEPIPADYRRAIRERYASIARGDAAGCCGPADEEADDEEAVDGTATCGCCGDDAGDDAGLAELTTTLGYDGAAAASVDGDANLGLGCGNPNALASLEPGERVLDLGSGGGFDCFLAAREVGPDGFVVGVDMTPEMVEKARRNADRNDAANVEFRLGEIEHLPVADASVDVVISNCVINLSPEKRRVFAEAFRVLRPGGRLSIADVVLTAPVPAAVRTDPDAIASCAGGAASIEELAAMVREAGFVDVLIEPIDDSHEFIRTWSDERDVSEYAVSAAITGRKPA